MKKINTGFVVDPTIQQPFTTKSLDFLQDANKEMISALCANLIVNRGYDPEAPKAYTIATFDITPYYYVYYQGEVFLYEGQNSPSDNIASILIVNDTTADPLLFTDNVNRNVHNKRILNASTGTLGTGLFNLVDLIDISTPESTLVKLRSNANSLTTINEDIIMTTVDRDTNNWYNESTGLFTPLKRGWYELQMNMLFIPTSGGTTDFALFKNGTLSETLQNGVTINGSGRSIYTTCFFANGTTDYFTVNINTIATLPITHTGIITFKFIES